MFMSDAKGEISRQDVEELRVLCWWEKPRLLDRFTPTLVSCHVKGTPLTTLCPWAAHVEPGQVMHI